MGSETAILLAHSASHDVLLMIEKGAHAYIFEKAEETHLLYRLQV